MSFTTSSIDEAIKEYLLFRGFASTFRSFENDIKFDKERGLSVENLVQQIFAFVTAFDVDGLVSFWDVLNRKFFSRLDQEFAVAARKLEISLKRYYLVHCVENIRQDKVKHFFELLAGEAQSPEWQEWWILPFIKNPETHPNFESFFLKSWLDSLSISLFNFLSSALNTVPLPFLLQIQKPKTGGSAPESTPNLRFSAAVPDGPRPEDDTRAVGVQETSLDQTESPARPSDAGAGSDSNPAEPDNDTVSSLGAPGAPLPAASATGTPGPATLQPAAPAPSTPASAAGLTAAPASGAADAKAAAPVPAIDVPAYSGHTAPVLLGLLSPRGRFAASLDRTHALHFWSCQSGHIVAKMSTRFEGATCMAWIRPSDRTLAIAHGANSVTLVEFHGLAPNRLLSVPGVRAIADIACSNLGDLLAVVATEDGGSGRGTLTLIDVGGCAVVGTWTVSAAGSSLLCAEFNADGTHVLVGDIAGKVHPFDIQQHRFSEPWAVHSGPVYHIKYMQNEVSVITLGGDGCLRRTTPADGKTTVLYSLRFPIPQGAPRGLRRFCGDPGDSLLLIPELGASGTESSVRLWRLKPAIDGGAELAPVRTVCAPNRAITAVDWCPAENTAVVAIDDNKVGCYPVLP
eukprot:m.257955 g.257955  ORF g.257955 m.257955 type:complete len:629 (-) comp21204_c0_seq1:118-2004(-)